MSIEMDVDEEAEQRATTPQTPSIPHSQNTIVCVEHPCIIKNLDRGIRSLGGEYAINKAFEGNKVPKSFEASLRPDDKMAKTICSRNVKVNHLALKVTVPKRTGRKRKRGSNGPFLAEAEHASTNLVIRDAEVLLRSLKDNAGATSIDVVGQIHDTHRFRSMPDYQYATSTNSLMRSLRATIMTEDPNKIAQFKVEPNQPLPEGEDVGPPPFFTTARQPFNYSYRQNIYVKTVTDAQGNLNVINITAPIKHIRHNVDPDALHVPDSPPLELPPLELAAPRIQKAVAQLKALLEERPLLQRRVFINLLQGKQGDNELKVASGYCGYAFTGGPYRDTMVKFGIDPRTDPKYRIYQTASFQIGEEGKGAPDDPGSYLRKEGGKRVTTKVTKAAHTHIFDGTKFYKDGKVWQVCDVTDPMLKELLDKAELREEVDMIFSGWYGNATWALFRRIMKYKFEVLGKGKTPNDDMCRAVAANFPSFIDESNVNRTRHDEPGSFFSQSDMAEYTMDLEASGLASEVRSMAMAAHRYRNRHYRGRLRKIGEEDVIMPDAGNGAIEGGEANKDGAVVDADEDEEDAALLGMDEIGEDEQESEDEGDEED